MNEIITVDGPSGAGKSTISRKLAQQLGYDYIDSGALYRVVALRAEEETTPGYLEQNLAEICQNLEVKFLEQGGHLHVFCQGRDVTDQIRAPQISLKASQFSAQKVVRDHLTGLQRRMAAPGRVVLEGRDAGTTVFPEASVKFFLDAAPEERGRRRYLELKAKGLAVDLARVTAEIIERDQNDRSRSLAPLRPAPDAVIIDSSAMTVETVLARMMDVVRIKINEGVHFNGQK